MIFQCIFHQVLYELPHLKRVRIQTGQITKMNDALGSIESCFKVFNDFTGKFGEVDFFERLSL